MTVNKAAAEIRHKILRKMRDIQNDPSRWEKLREYINGMAVRASKKKGGLGRK